MIKQKYDGTVVSMYTSGKYLPTPFASARYYHRPLDITALLETGFTRIKGEININEIKRSLLLPKNPLPNFSNPFPIPSIADYLLFFLEFYDYRNSLNSLFFYY